jgi:hypothetical protein
MSVNMDNGSREHFILNTLSAELVSVLWAHAVCPHQVGNEAERGPLDVRKSAPWDSNPEPMD